VPLPVIAQSIRASIEKPTKSKNDQEKLEDVNPGQIDGPRARKARSAITDKSHINEPTSMTIVK
jgi:biotin synthase-related radical SAM superfamily protein